jgi:colicin import membrane protein
MNNFELYLNEDERIKKYLLQALMAHVVIILIAFLFQFFLGVDWFQNKQTTKNITIVQSSVRVDVVEMPKFTVQELKKMEIAPPADDKVEAEAKETEVARPDQEAFKEVGKKVDLSNLLSKLSQKNTGKTPEKKVKAENNLNAHRADLQKLVLQGNKVSAGSVAVGDSLAQELTTFNKYVSVLPNFVRPHWKLPSYLLEKNLKCRIRVFIGANGKILRSQIFESSGVEEFDQRAMSSIMAVNTFPPPENEILARVASGEVILGFPL